MSRSRNIALATFGLLLASSTSSFAQTRGEMCMPAVADAGMYQNCRLTIVRGNEVCRCQIAPRAISRRGGVVGDNLESDRNERSRGVGVVGTTAAGNAGSVGAGAPAFGGGTVISGRGTSNGGGAAAPGASTPGGNNGGGKGNNGGGKGGKD